jgi:hypothetical protein
MKITARAIAARIAIAAILAACVSVPAALAADGTADVAITMGSDPFVVEGFESLSADGKIFVGTNKKFTYVNLTKSGWGGSEGLVISSSDQNVTEGKLSAKIDIDFKIRNRLQVNGACFGMGWDNTGMTPTSFGKNLSKVKYMLIDYVWEPAPECDIANPKVLNIGLHVAARDLAFSKDSKGEINNLANTDPSGKGTLVVKLSNTLTKSEVLTPQFALKVYHPSDDNDQKALAADLGKTVKGTLWLDNVRFADKDGNVFQK